MKVLAFCLLILHFNSYGNTQVFEGVVRYEGRIVYHEKHLVEELEGRPVNSIVEFTDEDEKLVGLLKNDFSLHPWAPAHILRDYRQDLFQGLAYDGKEAELYKKEAKAPLKVKFVEIPTKGDAWVSGEGLQFFIRENLEDLLANKTVDLNYIVPGNLMAYPFVMKVLFQDEKQVVFEVKLRSLWLGIFTPRLKLVYDLKKRRLLSFQGPSSLRNSKGNMVTVEVQYIYKH